MKALLIAALLAAAATTAAAQVVPSGGTATTVTTAPSGQITVGIAPVQSRGTSLNQYSAFSVPAAGVQLDNRSVGANTIVNTVVGTGRTIWQGPLQVLGSRAHVVVVNPNGFSIDGGSVVNAGGVALATGSVALVNGNVVLGSGTGDIAIGPGGFSGTMTSLQLIAGRLRIDGPVVDDAASPNAEINVLAGPYEVTLDGTVPAHSSLRPWASAKPLDGSSQEILVDVTPRGSLSASRVHIAVSARGAGVAFAGKGLASIGEFTIGADGKVSVAGGHIQAEKSVKIVAGAIEVLNTPAGQAGIASLSGAVTLKATAGDIDLRGLVTGARKDDGDPDSQGAVTLAATGDIRVLSEGADRLAIAFASDGDLAITAGGRLTNNTGRLLSNGNVRIAARSVVNTVDIVGAVDGGTPRLVLVRKKRMGLFGHRTIRVYRLDNERVHDAPVLARIDADEVENAGEIDAQDGALVVNAGSLVNRAQATGSVVYTKSCGTLCRTRGTSTASVVGGTMNAAAGLRLTATRSILNDGGTVTAYGNLALDAPSITAHALPVPVVATRPSGLRTLFSGHQSVITLAPAGGVFAAPGGTVTVRSTSPVLLNGGSLEGGMGVDAPAGITQGDPGPSQIGRRHDGLLWSWFDRRSP